MYMSSDHARFIDSLRKAAKDNPAVGKLLELIESFPISDGDPPTFSGTQDELDLLRAAQIASVFAAVDKEDKSDGQ